MEDERINEDTTVAGKQLAWVPLTENLQAVGMASATATMVREWRFEVQKAFLGRGRSRLQDSDMPAHDALFAEIEAYDMSVLHLEYSKIGKVMRHVGIIPDGIVPREAEFGFRARAAAMAERWRRILDSAKRVRELEEDIAPGRGLVEEEQEEEGVAMMPGSLGGYRDSGASALSSGSNGAPTSVLDWVRSQILEAQPGESFRISDGHEDGDPPATSDGELSALTVREWRNTLQKGFLSKRPASDEEMPLLHSLLTMIEDYQDSGKLLPSHITSSKIGKVMNHISHLPNFAVSRDGEFGFRERARALVEIWRGLLDLEGLDGEREMPFETTGYQEPIIRLPRYDDYYDTRGFGEKDPTQSTFLSHESRRPDEALEETTNETRVMELIDALNIEPDDKPSDQIPEEQDVLPEDWKLVEPEPETPRGTGNGSLPACSDGDDTEDSIDEWELVQP